MVSETEDVALENQGRRCALQYVTGGGSALLTECLKEVEA